VKLGQPVPDSSLVSDPNSGVPHATQAVHARALLAPVGSGERAFGAGLTRDPILLRREQATPLLFAFDDLAKL
jgi:hypothetical protein